MKIEWLTCSTLLVEISGQKRVWECTDAQTAVKLKQALEATDGSIQAVNSVIKEFKS